jgi:phosphoglycolate phosphatase
MERYEGYDAVVFDLDGTLVDLDVDWARVDESAAVMLDRAGVAPAEDAWAALDAAEAADVGGVHEMVCDHERRGAERSTRLPAADDLRALAEAGRPTAVCSLNCEAAVRIALNAHGLGDAPDAVVGRDSADARKPDPAALRAALGPLGVDPEGTLFVGDSPRDEETAERAGVDFRYVGEAKAN